MKLLLSIFLFLSILPSISAQYDTFQFNMSFFCGHPRQYTYEITFNIRDESQVDSDIKNQPIARTTGEVQMGITTVSVTGFFDKDAQRAPVWEPIVEIRHTCLANPIDGFKKLFLQFAPSPALRNKTMYIYKYYLDITDKSGKKVVDAEITKVDPPK